MVSHWCLSSFGAQRRAAYAGEDDAANWQDAETKIKSEITGGLGSMSALLEVKHADISFGGIHAVKDLSFIVHAGEIVGLLYDAFAKQYADPTSERAMKSLNVLCVRLVFCLYAEDAGIFGGRGMFHDYLAEFDARKMRRAITDLFKILDTKTRRS